MEPAFVEMDEMIAVGLPTFNSTKYNLIGQLWERYMKREPEISNVVKEKVWLGVTWDCDQIKPEKEGGEPEYRFFHLAGRVVSEVGDVPEGLAWKKIPAHNYVKFTHRGSLEKLQDTYRYIWGEWFPKSGKEFDPAACEFEWYDTRFNPEGEDSEFDIYIPIK